MGERESEETPQGEPWVVSDMVAYTGLSLLVASMMGKARIQNPAPAESFEDAMPQSQFKLESTMWS